jgi:hypothetical protein
MGDQLRIRVSIRSIHPIDTVTPDENDLRLIDSLGGRRKLRLVDLVQDGGVVRVTYRISRSFLATGPATVVASDGQVVDNQGNGWLARELGTFAV